MHNCAHATTLEDDIHGRLAKIRVNLPARISPCASFGVRTESSIRSRFAPDNVELDCAEVTSNILKIHMVVAKVVSFLQARILNANTSVQA